MLTKTFAFATLMTISVLATSARAIDPIADAYWPSFRGAERTGISQDAGLLERWPDDGPPLAWTAKGAGRGYSSVSIANGRLYTLGDAPSTASDKDEYLTCFDLSNGDQLWKMRLGGAWTEGKPDWQSSRSTPTIDGERVYVLTPQGALVCADVDDGSEIWKVHLLDDLEGEKGDRWGYSESVLIDGDLVVCTPGGEKNTMVALNKNSGEMVWSAAREGDKGAGHSCIVPTNIYGQRIYLQQTASGPMGVQADDGTLLWTYAIPEMTAVIPTPIVKDDLVFFTAGYGTGGALLRQVQSDRGSIDVEEVYSWNGKLENKHGGVVLLGEKLYGDSGDAGIPFCADLVSGEVAWKKRGSGRKSAAFAAADGHLYIRFSNAVMALAKATPEGYEEVSTFEIPGGGDRPSWAHPVITGGRLYLREGDQIHCYDLRSNAAS